MVPHLDHRPESSYRHFIWGLGKYCQQVSRKEQCGKLNAWSGIITLSLGKTLDGGPKLALLSSIQWIDGVEEDSIYADGGCALKQTPRQGMTLSSPARHCINRINNKIQGPIVSLAIAKNHPRRTRDILTRW